MGSMGFPTRRKWQRWPRAGVPIARGSRRCSERVRRSGDRQRWYAGRRWLAFPPSRNKRKRDPRAVVLHERQRRGEPRLQEFGGFLSKLALPSFATPVSPRPCPGSATASKPEGRTGDDEEGRLRRGGVVDSAPRPADRGHARRERGARRDDPRGRLDGAGIRRGSPKGPRERAPGRDRRLAARAGPTRLPDAGGAKGEGFGTASRGGWNPGTKGDLRGSRRLQALHHRPR